MALKKKKDTEPDDAAVLEYLKTHPDFLSLHPEALEYVVPPSYHSDDRVVDMQRFAVDKLREELRNLRKHHQELLQASRDNLSTQNQVLTAALTVLQAAGLKELVETVQTDLAGIFNVDVVRLALVSELGPEAETNQSGLMAISENDFTTLMGEEKVMLLAEQEGSDALFGSHAELVRSQALIRLEPGSSRRPGILAFGDRHAQHFHPGQGAELLSFLGRIVEHRLAQLLRNS